MNCIHVQVYRNKFVFHFLKNKISKMLILEKMIASKRLLIGAFTEAINIFEKTVKANYKSFIKPSIIIQPMEIIDYGFSESEERIFFEFGYRTGAKKNSIILNDDELPAAFKA